MKRITYFVLRRVGMAMRIGCFLVYQPRLDPLMTRTLVRDTSMRLSPAPSASGSGDNRGLPSCIDVAYSIGQLNWRGRVPRLLQAGGSRDRNPATSEVFQSAAKLEARLLYENAEQVCG